MYVANGVHSLRYGSPFGGDADVQLCAAHRADEGALVGGVLALIFKEVGNVTVGEERKRKRAHPFYLHNKKTPLHGKRSKKGIVKDDAIISSFTMPSIYNAFHLLSI